MELPGSEGDRKHSENVRTVCVHRPREIFKRQNNAFFPRICSHKPTSGLLDGGSHDEQEKPLAQNALRMDEERKD